jgi:hypothetical protein
VPLGAEVAVVVHDGIENRGQHATLGTRLPPEAVKHVLSDRCVSDQLGPAQDLEVSGNGGLGQLEHGLEIRDEQGCGRQAIENSEPGRLGYGH